MIPLRLTAVAAQNDMPVFTWIYADAQAVPTNYEHFEIATEDIVFFDFGGNDYQSQLRDRPDELGGRAFVTEFAGPSNSLEVTHPWLLANTLEFDYVTRLSTTISPVEMTVDPVFALDASMPDVSNIKDASEMRGLYECERLGGEGIDDGFVSVTDSDDDEQQAATTISVDDFDDGDSNTNFTALWIVVGIVAAGALVMLGRQSVQR